MKRIKSFIADQSGVVTVDWVVLTAGIVSFGLLVMSNVGTGVTSVSQGISDTLGTITIGAAP